MRLLVLSVISACLAEGSVMAETCTTLIDHSNTEQGNPWVTVNDGVMGGLSDGGSSVGDGVLSFAGVTNTNGGGFSSIRLPIPRGAMAGAQYLKVEMKRDARDYSLTLRTNVRSYGRRIAFRAPIKGAPEGAWGDGVLSFDDLRASIWGRPVRNAVFDPAETVEIGLIIYDGKDGPFKMQLKRIQACRVSAGADA
jgi:NADH dehydrogenase [ubiquinone] 1 alpha subcomplex assembly factor 1